MRFFVVSNHTPDQVESWLKSKFNITVNKTFKRTQTTLFYYDLAVLKTECPKIHSNSNVVLFTGPITAQSLVSASLLDLSNSIDPPHYGIKKTKLSVMVWKNAQITNSVEFEKYEHFQTIVDELEKKSILNCLMTSIYTLSASSQKLAKTAIVNWMFYDGKLSHIDIMLDGLASKIKLKSVRSELRNIMRSDLMTKYVIALHEKGSVEEIALKYSLSEYELRYLSTAKVSKKEYLSIIKE